MTWASASCVGGGEKIGEVRMFVGEVPEGWAAMSRLYSARHFPNSSTWIVGPRISNSANNTSSGGNHKGVSLIGDDKVLVAGDFQASITSAPASTTLRIISLADGLEVFTSSITLTRPAIFNRMSNGSVLIAGGIRSTSGVGTPSNTVFSIDQNGVTTILAPMPEVGSSGVSGVLPDGRHAVFGLRNGDYGNTGTLRCLAYSETTNSWEYLPDLPHTFTYSGAVAEVGGRTFLIGRGVNAQVYEYLPGGPVYYQQQTFTYPESVSGWSGAVSCAPLADGRTAVYVCGVSFGGAAATYQHRIFAFDGQGFESLADLPPAVAGSSTNRSYSNALADTGARGVTMPAIIIANEPGVGGATNQSYILPEQSASYIALAAIKYARKLP